MIREPDLLEVDEGVDGSKESAVEPSTTLGDEFGDRIYFKVSVMMNTKASRRTYQAHRSHQYIP